VAAQKWHRAWVRQKCDIAGRLARGEAGAGYAEAVILLCAAVSALSAEVWPGTGKDRARFVELLVRFGSFRDLCMTVSVPLLVHDLQALARDSEATALRRAASLPDSARVLTGPEVDRVEADVLAVCPSLDVSYVRKFSYAALLYQEVRSSYAHEYRPGASANSIPMTMATGQAASYVNQLREPTLTRIDRTIHFHVPWLIDLADDLATAVDSAASLPLPEPSLWWIKGG
jgi:hypothetical protein